MEASPWPQSASAQPSHVKYTSEAASKLMLWTCLWILIIVGALILLYSQIMKDGQRATADDLVDYDDSQAGDSKKNACQYPSDWGSSWINSLQSQS